MSDTLLEVTNLSVGFPMRRGVLRAANRVSFSLGRHQTVGIVGESGCGKSVVSASIMRLLPPYAEVSGSIRLNCEGEALELSGFGDNSPEITRIRGRRIGMIFQEPMAALFPMRTVGAQMVEAIRLHRERDRKRAREIAIEMLADVRIKEPEKWFSAYPYQLSGGMCQRVMIAMALSCGPDILIADEPTTALDVTIQAQVLGLLREIQEKRGMSILFISHDMGVIVEMSDVVIVMYAGQIVERAPVAELFRAPAHPYTVALLNSILSIDGDRTKRLFSIEGTVPTPIGMDDMCGFFSRCPRAMKGVCDRALPPPTRLSGDHAVSCFLYRDEEVSL